MPTMSSRMRHIFLKQGKELHIKQHQESQQQDKLFPIFFHVFELMCPKINNPLAIQLPYFSPFFALRNASKGIEHYFMKREFLLNAIFLVLANVIVKPFYVFGIERTIQDEVGAVEYGTYATLFSFTFLLFMVNDFGIHYFNNRTIAQHPHLVDKYFPNILFLKSILAVFYIGFVFLAAWLRGFEFAIFNLIFFVALNHVLTSTVAYLRSNISGLGMYRTDSLISTLDKVLLIGICAVLLWASPFGPDAEFQIEWFVHSLNVSWFLTAVIAFFIVKKHLKNGFRFRLNWPFMLVILKKSFPFALAVFLMTAYTRFDIVILEWILPEGRYEAGVYAASYRLLDAFVMVGYLFSGLLLPMFSAQLKDSSNAKILESAKVGEETQSLLRFAFQLILGGTTALAVSSFFFQEELMRWLYPQSVNDGNANYYGEVMGYLILTLVPFCGVFIYSSLLTANDSLKKMNRLFLVCIGVNISLNLILIPQMKAPGAALSALLTQATVLSGLMWLCKKELGLPFLPKEAIRIISFLAASTIAAWQIHIFDSENWLLRFTICITACLILAFLFRLIRISAFLDLVKKQD